MKPDISRRDFMRSAGALIVSFSASPMMPSMEAQIPGAFDTHPSEIDPSKLDSWIAVGADGTVTAYTGKCDFGQGMFTAQTQLVAEELCLSIEKVKLVQCDTSITPDQGTTSGSQSSSTNFRTQNLAQAAATAREALIGLAAQKFGCSVEQLRVSDGSISHETGKQVTYSQLLGGKHFDLVLNPQAKRIPANEWKVLGKPINSLDRVALMTGTFEFVHTVQVPGMVHGRVVRPPEMGATLISVDEASVRSIPGLIKVVVVKDFVGVVAETQYEAAQAAKMLKVNWKPGPGLPPRKDYYSYLRTQPSREQLVINSKDVDDVLKSATQILKSTYYFPHQAHGSLGSSCAVADVKGNRATVWSPTQSAYPTRHGVAALTGIPVADVRVIYVRGSGCYGLNGADTVSFDAALLSHAVQRPVRVQLTRHDEFVSESYGQPYVIDQQIGLDASGSIIAWDCESWAGSYGGRPGYNMPGNVITGLLAGYPADTVKPHKATEPRGTLRNGSNSVPSYMAGSIDGKSGGAGSIGSERVMSHTVQVPFFTGPLRSPLRIQNTFAHESFIDEVSAQVKADPVAYRLKYLTEIRVIDCVKAAAKAANWEVRLSPKPGNARTGVVKGRGIAAVAYEGDNGYAAVIAEVEVDQASGQVHVSRFTIAHDCGPISNPDGIRSQVEGGLLQGMSRSLGEEITWDDRKVTSIDWASYHSLRLGLQAPIVETVLLDRPALKATGAGETAITLVPAAIGNAIFDATGARLREVPFTPERVQAALAARVV